MKQSHASTYLLAQEKGKHSLFNLLNQWFDLDNLFPYLLLYTALCRKIQNYFGKRLFILYILTQMHGFLDRSLSSDVWSSGEREGLNPCVLWVLIRNSSHETFNPPWQESSSLTTCGLVKTELLSHPRWLILKATKIILKRSNFL